MKILQNTILILVLATPILVYATTKEPEAIQETPVEEEVEIIVEKEYTISAFKDYAEQQVTEKWGEEYVSSFKQIVHKESSWRHNKEHYADGKSSATGFGGFLNDTWGNVGCVKTYDQYEQLDCMIKYIEQRYDNPVKALSFHNSRGWY